MKDKYDEIVRCSRCKREVIKQADEKKDKKREIRFDTKIAMVFCKECWTYVQLEEYNKLDAKVLGITKFFVIPLEANSFEVRVLSDNVKQKFQEHKKDMVTSSNRRAPSFMYFDEKVWDYVFKLEYVNQWLEDYKKTDRIKTRRQVYWKWKKGYA